MKLRSLAKRLAAALLSGAMALSLCAPALAQAPSGGETFTVNGKVYSMAENHTIDSGSGTLTYDAVSHTLRSDDTITGSLDLDAPGVQVVLYGKTANAINGALTITASAGVTIDNQSTAATDGGERQAIRGGQAKITSSGAVRIAGADRAVGSDGLVIDAGGDVKITGGCAGAAIWQSANITSGGSVTIGTTSANGWAQGSGNNGEKLTIMAAQDVTLTGTASYPVMHNAAIQCGGSLKIETSAAAGKAANGTLTYTNTSSAEKVLRDASTFQVVAAGGTCSITSDASCITAQAEQRYSVTVENGYAQDASGTRRTAFYKGETVTLVAQRPASTDEFLQWEAPGITFAPNDTDKKVTFTMPDRNVSVTTNWNAKPDAEIRLVVTAGGRSTTIYPIDFRVDRWDPSGTGNSSLALSYQDGTYTFTGNWPANTSVSFTAFAPTASQLPSVVLNGSIGGDLTVESVKDFTISSSPSGFLIQGSSAVFTGCTGNVTLTNLTGVTLRKNLTVDIDGDLNIDSGRSAVSGILTVENARDVTIKGGSSPLMGAGGYPGTHTIRCSGTVTLENRAGGMLVECSQSNAPLLYTQADDFPYTVARNDVPGELQSGTYPVTYPADLSNVHKLVITPELPDVPNVDISGGSGSVGGAIAAAAIGGAAVWGGYEVVTRVMLYKLLPKGAAIPKTQGELALLLWNTAGQPDASAASYVYPDITDTRLQTAARWCTEQGYMTARSDGTFGPDKHVTKYRVIRTWTRAFPQQ